MTALTTCVRKAGKALNKPDADAIGEIATEYRSDGQTAQEAANSAIVDYLDILSTERADILVRAQEAGADMASDPRGLEAGMSLNTAQRAEESQRGRLRDAGQAERERIVAEQRSPQIRFSLKDSEVDQVNNDPTHPESVKIKLLASQEEAISALEGHEPGHVKRIFRKMKDQYHNNKGGFLGALSLRAMSDVAENNGMAEGKNYQRIVNRMSGAENQLQQEILQELEPWKQIARKNKPEARRLADLMHESTLAGINPAKPFVPKLSDKQRMQHTKLKADLAAGRAKSPLKVRQQIRKLEEIALLDAKRKASLPALKKAWKALLPESRSVYQGVLRKNEVDFTRMIRALESRINQTEGVDEKTRSSLIAKLRRDFESGHVDPYFTLARFGMHWAVARDSEKNIVGFTKSDSLDTLTTWRKGWDEAGYETDEGTDEALNQGDISRVDPGFAQEVAQLIQQSSNKEEANRLASEMWQMYLKRLPEMSARKAFIHRQGVPGYTSDAMRAFADHAFHAARQITKAEYGYQLEQSLQKINEEARVERSANQNTWASALGKEYQLRHNWIMEPRVSGWAAKLTTLGTHWFLGMNPSSAAVNLTQTWQVGLAVLAAKNNGRIDKAAFELGRASKQMIGTEEFTRKNLSEDEMNAFEEFRNIGLFDITRASELMAAGEQGLDVTSRLFDFGQLSMYMFQKAEQFNREVTSLAAYRMARSRGLKHDAAVLEAEDVTWDSHFDYSNKNRPRLMQKDWVRVVLLFRNYGANMTYRLARDMKDTFALRKLQPGKRREAITRMAGIWGMTLLMAGVKGAPMLWLGMEAWELAFGDEDDPVDMERAIHLYLAELWGADRANQIMNGVLDDLIGAAMSTRVSLANLWFMDAPEETSLFSPAWLAHYAAQAAGPLGSAVYDAAVGADMIGRGHTERGMEKMAPAAVKNVMKAVRYFQEGVKTLIDTDVLPEDTKLGAKDYFVQAFGMTPTEVARAYDVDRATRAVTKKLDLRKGRLRDRYLNAKTDAARTAALDDIHKFDKTNPDYPIERTLGRAIRGRARAKRDYMGGVRVPRRLRKRIGKMRQTLEENDDE